MSCGSEGCPLPTRIRYPGNDPENGPAREYCKDGHSTCYSCGRWFRAITRYEAWTDEATGQEIPAGSTEAEWCPDCERAHHQKYCGCGSDPRHFHDEWACCGGSMCCPDANE